MTDCTATQRLKGCTRAEKTPSPSGVCDGEAPARPRIWEQVASHMRHTRVRGHTGSGSTRGGCESTVWVRTTAWEPESESVQPPQRWWLQRGRGGLRGREEDLEGLVPRQSPRRVPTHPMDSLPWKSCPNLGDDTQTSQPQTLKHQQPQIPAAQRGKLRPRERQGPT